MFISKRKIINELKQALHEKDEVLAKAEKELVRKEEELAKVTKERDEFARLHDATPSDCKRGTWCEACEFAKKYALHKGVWTKEYYFCGKAESCSNFVQKEK